MESDSGTDATDDPGDMTGDQDTTLTVEIEGETETIPGIRHNSVLGYAVTYDPERFALNIVDEYAESYMADIVEGQPNVYLAVSVIEDELDELTFDDVVEGMRIQQNIEDEGTTVSVGAHSYAATYLRYAAGTEDNDEIVLLEDGQVDAGELAREAFVLGMDTKTLCSEDCKGLCPRCGADLNLGPCSCKKDVDPRLAVLAKLLENK